MAALTWRSVAAPDFSGIQGGISNAGEFFNRGFNTVQKTLDNVQTIREDNAVREVLGRALASNDPAAIQAMAAEAAQNPNFTMRGLDILNRQVDTLQRRNLTNEQINTARQAREQGATLFDRESNLYAARQAAAPIIAEAMSKGESPEAAMKTLSGNPATAGLGVNDITSIYNSFLNSRGENLNYNIRSTEFAQGQADRADREAGQNYVSSVLSNTLDSSVARQRIDADVAAGRLTPGAAAYARRSAGLDTLPFDPATGMPRGVPGVAGVSNTDPLRTMNYEARGKGFSAVPSSVQTLGQFRDFAKTVNNAGVASSAAGPWQMVGTTAERHARNLWGNDWANRPFDIATLDKLAEAAYNERVAGKDPVNGLRNEWEALRKLPDDQVRALANAGWAGARNTIASLESSASPDVLRLEGAALNTSRQVKQAGTDTSGTVDAIRNFSTDNTPQNDVINDLVKNIPGSNARDVTRILNQVMKGANVNAKIAGEAIKNKIGTSPAGGWLDWFSNDAVGGGRNVDVNATITDLLNAKRTAPRQSASDLDMGTRQNQQAQARAIAAQADAEYQNAANTVAARGLDPSQLAPYARRRDQAWAAVDALQAGDPDRQSSPAPAASSQGKPQSGRPSVAQVARPSQGSGNAIDKYGQDWRSRARAVREATGARRVTLEDQFQRLYGKSIPQAEAENASREKSAAQAVLRLGGAIGQRQRAEFQRTYGRTPEAALGR